MAINKKLIHFKTFANFNSQKLSANEANTKYTTGVSGTETTGNPDILYQSICFIKDTQQIWTHGCIYSAPSNILNIIEENELVTAEALADLDDRLKVVEEGGGDIEVPTKTSDLTNDSGFITADDTVAKANQLTTARNINGNVFNGTTDITNYVTCSTGASTTAKTASISTGFTLKTGSQVRVKFSAVNTASAPTLNIQSTGAKRMSYKGSLITNANFTFNTNKIYTFTYDGTYWVLEGDWDTVDISGKQDKLVSGTSIKTVNGESLLGSGNIAISSSQPIHFFQMDGGSGNTYLISRMSADSVLPTRVGDIITVFNTTSVDFNITNDSQILYDGTTTMTYSVVGEAFTIKPLSSVSFVLANDTTLTPIVPVVSTSGGNTSSTAESANTLSTARNINGISFNGSADITNYGTCSTAASTAAKTVNITGFSLVAGARVSVNFTSGNTAGSMTLNVSNTGAKSVVYRGNANTPTLDAGTYDFIYTGSQWELLTSKANNRFTIERASINAAAQPNTFIRFYYSTGVASLNVSSTTTANPLYEYAFSFNSGSTATTFTYPSTWKWANGNIPSIKANKTYHVSVIDNCAVIAEF